MVRRAHVAIGRRWCHGVRSRRLVSTNTNSDEEKGPKTTTTVAERVVSTPPMEREEPSTEGFRRRPLEEGRDPITQPRSWAELWSFRRIWLESAQEELHGKLSHEDTVVTGTLFLRSYEKPDPKSIRMGLGMFAAARGDGKALTYDQVHVLSILPLHEERHKWTVTFLLINPPKPNYLGVILSNRPESWIPNTVWATECGMPYLFALGAYGCGIVRVEGPKVMKDAGTEVERWQDPTTWREWGHGFWYWAFPAGWLQLDSRKPKDLEAAHKVAREVLDMQWPDITEEGIAAAKKGALGLALTEVRYRYGRRHRVLVFGVDPDSVAARAGIKPTDLLIRVNGEPIFSVEDLRESIREASSAPASECNHPESDRRVRDPNGFDTYPLSSQPGDPWMGREIAVRSLLSRNVAKELHDGELPTRMHMYPRERLDRYYPGYVYPDGCHAVQPDMLTIDLVRGGEMKTVHVPLREVIQSVHDWVATMADELPHDTVWTGEKMGEDVGEEMATPSGKEKEEVLVDRTVAAARQEVQEVLAYVTVPRATNSNVDVPLQAVVEPGMQQSHTLRPDAPPPSATEDEDTLMGDLEEALREMSAPAEQTEAPPPPPPPAVSALVPALNPALREIPVGPWVADSAVKALCTIEPAPEAVRRYNVQRLSADVQVLVNEEAHQHGVWFLDLSHEAEMYAADIGVELHQQLQSEKASWELKHVPTTLSLRNKRAFDHHTGKVKPWTDRSPLYTWTQKWAVRLASRIGVTESDTSFLALHLLVLVVFLLVGTLMTGVTVEMAKSYPRLQEKWAIVRTQQALEDRRRSTQLSDEQLAAIVGPPDLTAAYVEV